SIAFYNSVSIELVIIIFMILSGIHFGFIYSFLLQRNKMLFKSQIVKYYITALAIGIIITSFDLYGNIFHSYFTSLRYSAFQIISIGTSTGFANTDSSIWPAASQLLLIFFALQCACAGSTSGGIKTDRIVMLGKDIIRQVKLLRHPRAIFNVKIDDKSIADNSLACGILYICAYLIIVFLATFLLTIMGVDMISAFSGAVAATGNVGPGLGTVGSTSNFSHIPILGKFTLTAAMLLGRLEIYGLILFFYPQIWKRRKRAIL
ncbi:TrkH family potassium uptake protein, partial [candidate division KSB1 bacterium]|nr:TrkH family potassium uptake protein [candidate division KSB1 bacterium]